MRTRAAASRTALGLLLLLALAWFPNATGTATAAEVAAADEVGTRFALTGLTLRPGEVGRTRLLVTNPTPDPVRIAAVRTFGSPLVIAKPERRVVGRRLEAGELLRLPFRVRVRDGFETSNVTALVSGRRANGASGARWLATADLAVTAAGPRKQPTVAIVGLPASVRDGEEGQALLRLTNETGEALGDVRLTGHPSGNVTLRPRCAAEASETSKCTESKDGTLVVENVPAAAVLTLPLAYDVDDRVRTGAQQVSLTVAAASATRPGAQPYRAAADQKVDVTVYGVDVLAPFGVAGLFVVPGLVLVVVFLALGRYAYPREQVVPDVADFKDPRAMVAIVPLSALVYVVVWLVLGQDLTRSVSTWDVVWLFAAAALIGLAAWGVLASMYWRRTGRKQYRPGDEPLEVLRTMDRRKASLTLRRVADPNGELLFLLAPAGKDRSTCCGRIRYAFNGEEAAKHQETFETAVQSGDLAAVVEAAGKPTASLRWESIGVLEVVTTPSAAPPELVLSLEVP